MKSMKIRNPNSCPSSPFMSFMLFMVKIRFRASSGRFLFKCRIFGPERCQLIGGPEFFTMKDMKSMKIRNPNSCPSSPFHVLHALHAKNQVPCFFLALPFLGSAYSVPSAVN